jgi:hypothetical protein
MPSRMHWSGGFHFYAAVALLDNIGNPTALDPNLMASYGKGHQIGTEDRFLQLAIFVDVTKNFVAQIS